MKNTSLKTFAPVPKTRSSRLLNLGGLATKVASNVLAEGTKRWIKGDAPPISELVLNTKNLSEVADKLARMRGAAMKLGQLLSMDAGTLLPVELASVLTIGGGNIFRGLQGSAQGMERTTADYMGMLATVMNALAMQSALETLGVFTRVISAIPMDQICEPYIRRRAVRHLEKKRVCIFAAGTGNPYFTTDTAAALRASEMACEAIFMGKQVDGIYDSDPKKNPNAKRFERISYDDVLRDNLKVADASAIALCRDNKMPLVVFSLDEPGGFRGILAGEGTYTTVHG